jgi:thiol-disulfide isomerase/thioredoxin
MTTAKGPWVTIGEAATGDKPLMVLITNSETCPPCKTLEGMLADKRIVAWMKHFSCVKYDTAYEEAPPRFKSVGTPHIQFIAAPGRVSFDNIQQKGCPASVESLMRLFHKAYQKLPRNSNPNLAQNPDLAAPAPTARLKDAEPAWSEVRLRSSGRYRWLQGRGWRAPLFHGLGPRAWQPRGQRG